MPRVALLDEVPEGHGSLSANPPQSVLTRGKPSLKLRIECEDATTGSLVLRLQTYSRKRAQWMPRGLIELLPTLDYPIENCLALSDDMRYACAVKVTDNEFDGTVRVYLTPSYERALDGGLEAVEEHVEVDDDPHPPYLTQAEADELYQQLGQGGQSSTAPIQWHATEATENGQGLYAIDVEQPVGSVVVVYIGGVPLFQARGEFTVNLEAAPPAIILDEELATEIVAGMEVTIGYQPVAE